jgi:hypothetical protein
MSWDTGQCPGLDYQESFSKMTGEMTLTHSVHLTASSLTIKTVGDDEISGCPTIDINVFIRSNCSAIHMKELILLNHHNLLQ